jgi:hypothetical protein
MSENLSCADEIREGGGVHFGHDLGAVGFDRTLGDIELGGGLFVEQAADE